MAFSANQTKLFYTTTGSIKKGTATAFANEVLYLMELPELGGTPEKIDVTTLSDATKQYIPGTKDFGDLVFKFLYDNADENANFRVLKGMDEAGTVAAFKIVYPDGTAHAFDAIPAVKLDAGTLNGALTFSATMTLQSDIEMIDYPGKA